MAARLGAAGGHQDPGETAGGDGSVYRSSDGRWRGVVGRGWDERGRRRKYVSGATQAEALERLRKAERDAKAGVVTDDRLSVGAFLERLTTTSLPGTVTETTLDDYRHPVRLHLAPSSPWAASGWRA